jgi:predicted lipid-binding transport protein (Tim44 family)
MFDFILVFLALAILASLVLRRALGERTERQRPPAVDPVRKGPGDKVLLLPRRANGPIEKSAPADRYAGIPMPGSPAAKGLDAIMAADNKFDARHFIDGARAAYEMTVMAYAEGDRQALKNLLAPEIYEGFEAVIREREARGETAETRFVSIDATDITAAELRGKKAQITLRFVSQLVSVTRDRNGNVIDGSADNVPSVTDVWTFTRDVTAHDLNWKLVATEADA